MTLLIHIFSNKWHDIHTIFDIRWINLICQSIITRKNVFIRKKEILVISSSSFLVDYSSFTPTKKTVYNNSIDIYIYFNSVILFELNISFDYLKKKSEFSSSLKFYLNFARIFENSSLCLNANQRFQSYRITAKLFAFDT